MRSGILHNEPRLVIMPDDPALGEFRKDVRQRASGDIEEYTGTPGFGGSLETDRRRGDVEAPAGEPGGARRTPAPT